MSNATVNRAESFYFIWNVMFKTSKSAKDNSELGLRHVILSKNIIFVSALLLEQELPCLCGQGTTCQSPGQMWKLAGSWQAWVILRSDWILCAIIKVFSSSFFKVLLCLNLCSLSLAFLQLYGHFVLKSKTMIINRKWAFCKDWLSLFLGFCSDVTGLK